MITKPSDHLESDRRFKHWGKVVRAGDVDLTKANGYSLAGGTWVKWDESVALEAGEYLVVASETGSAKYHSYSYRLIDSDGQRVAQKETITPALDAALADGRVSEKQMAAAQNSVLYAYGLYIKLAVTA